MELCLPTSLSLCSFLKAIFGWLFLITFKSTRDSKADEAHVSKKGGNLMARKQRRGGIKGCRGLTGIDRTPDQMETAMSIIRSDLERGMSPSQIAQGRATELHVSQSTIYRWIANGCCGLTQPRAKKEGCLPTSLQCKGSNPNFSWQESLLCGFQRTG